jgi:hypothetical protein
LSNNSTTVSPDFIFGTDQNNLTFRFQSGVGSLLIETNDIPQTALALTRPDNNSVPAVSLTNTSGDYGHGTLTVRQRSAGWIGIAAVRNSSGATGNIFQVSNESGTALAGFSANGYLFSGGAFTPTANGDFNGATGYNQLRMRTSYTPTGVADALGNTGDLAWDESFLHLKTAAGWKKASLSTTGLTPPGGSSGQIQFNNAGAFGGGPYWDGSNLGIGTTGPSARVHVNDGQLRIGGSTAGGVFTTGINTKGLMFDTDASNQGVEFVSFGGGSGYGWRMRTEVGSNISYLRLDARRNSGTFTNRVTFDDQGNATIGGKAIVTTQLGVGIDPAGTGGSIVSLNQTSPGPMFRAYYNGGTRITWDVASDGTPTFAVFNPGDATKTIVFVPGGGSYLNGGTFALGGTSATAKLDVTAATGYNQLRMRTSYTPTGSADALGNVGDLAWDADYLYIKTAAGAWKRVAISTF